MNDSSIVLPVHIDPAHAYFEVDVSIVAQFKLTPSRFSFVSPDGKTYYLEEDVDAEQLILALSKNGVGFSFTEVNHAELAFFRNYPRATRTVH